ncbi:MAG: D-alanyl-D-alanine carboxypeptidase [Candidatus Aenigmarchaeota archaeon]|nr:D-alanyl-D-alanine carboxypeptidase [Candidatus Aenigmarchaeota archaeon]
MLWKIVFNLYLVNQVILASFFSSTKPVFLITNQDNQISSEQEIKAPQRINLNHLGTIISAKNGLVIDQKSKKILYQKNPNQSSSIASITKLMSMLVLDELDLSPEMTVIIQDSDKEIEDDGACSEIEIGEVVRVKDLLHLALISSDNDAVKALVRISGLTEQQFIQRMNQKAQTIGLSNTYFADPTGLNSDNSSTVIDLARLLTVVLEKSSIAQLINQRYYSFSIVNQPERIIKVYSTDRLLDSFLNTDPYHIIGGKTGYLDEAGYCFTFLVNNQDDHPLMIVLLGADSSQARWQEAKGLAIWTWENYQWLK